MSTGPERGAHEERAAAGWCAVEVEEELPGLRLLIGEALHTRAQPLTGGSPPEVRQRLRELSNRFRGARAVGVRREPVPAAYRVFFRQIGLDPDVVRTPIEAAVLERMLSGGFLPSSLLEDVLLIALLDTGVPVWALDTDRLDGPHRRARERRGRADRRFAAGARTARGPARRGRLLGGARRPLRRARARAPATLPQHPRDAVHGAGGRGADAVRGRVAVGVSRRARAVLGGELVVALAGPEPARRACARW